MTLEFSVDPALTVGLREEILDCWTEVSQAGGAVGFVPPVTRADIAPAAGQAYAGVDDGRDRLIVGRTIGGPTPGRLAALAFLVDGQHGLSRHWRSVKRVMVHPDFQGLGYGAELMAAVERLGRSMGLEMLHLDCRSGTGVDLFYKRCGYAEWGRFPRALRVAEDDYRELINLCLQLQTPVDSR
ncbi:MAG TPA: GNAT family N-acetyltransferase [Actinocrinis sp.]|nr:GNAT family N-acetyltransferase [Actinocrinis sp.]